MLKNLYIADRYKINDLEKDLIGQDQIARFYRGTDTHTGKHVAIRILKPEFATGRPEIAQMFLRETELLKQLNHPNIETFLDVVQEQENFYAISEFVKGGTIQSLLDQQGQLAIKQTVQIGLDLCDALTRVHRLGIIHRDLKPSTILLTEEGTPKLTGFGIAYTKTMPNTVKQGGFVGTVYYASPETCQGKEIDERTDIWSFGVVLYEMLTGQLPFDSPNDKETIQGILTQPVPDPSRLRPDLPPSLAHLIQLMLQKDVSKRIPSIRLVGSQLEAILYDRDMGTGMVGITTENLLFADTAVPTPTSPGSTILQNRFVQEEPFAMGGMGTLYRGQDLSTGKIVAIKRLKSELVAYSPETVTRFFREGEALRQLNHPNIVKILAMVEDKEHPVIIMEHISGGDLQQLLDNESPLPLLRVLDIGLEIADALTRAHHLNILHRDIKPANVLLAADGTTRLIDFGIARLEQRETRITRTGEIIGTIAYLSPEVFRGEELDARSDIWAFGILLYELLAGRPPFTGGQMAATLMAILNDPIPDLVQYRPDTPHELVTLIEQMLIKDREQRIDSMRLVAAKLEKIRNTLHSK
ncbi:MAG: serine/threonine protein kinase [Ardenticatenaceae bacterium]|nr:serine/threonine protein kinase [Ardenticatenaceae bacterium]